MNTRTVTATEARIHFGELMRRVVDRQESVTVERAGRPYVVILSIDEYERLVTAQPEQPHWEILVEEAHAQVKAELGDREPVAPEEIIRLMREDRDAQLLDLR